MKTRPEIECGMSRRDFSKTAVAAGAAAVALPWSARGGGMPKAGSEEKVILAGAPKGSGDEVIERAVREAAEAATDFSWLEKGDSVYIKPVLNSGNPYPATTSPVAIRAMVKLLKDRGAGRVVVSDMSGVEHVKLSEDGLRGSSRKLMQTSGIAGAAEAAGAELYFPEEDGWEAFFEDGLESGGHWKNGVMMPKILKDMDHVVLIPRTGRHVLAGASLGLKAAVGYIRHDSRLEFHKHAKTLQEKTAELNTAHSIMRKQRLVLTAADKVLTTYGPDKGYVVEPETGPVMASTSVVAHDMASLAWLLINREATPEDEKSGRKDPHTMSISMVSGMNRVVVMVLGGGVQAARAEKHTKDDISRIEDDRVMLSAYKVFGRPRVTLEPANEAATPELQERIAGYL